MNEYYHYIYTEPDQDDYPMLLSQISIAFIELLFLIVAVGEIVINLNS